jgi:hypothetical protein
MIKYICVMFYHINTKPRRKTTIDNDADDGRAREKKLV